MDLKTAIPILTAEREPESEGERQLVSFNDSAGRAMLKNKEIDTPVITAVNAHCLTLVLEMVMGAD